MALSSDATSDSQHDSAQHASLGELFSRLATDTSTLVRQEVALAKVELGQKAAGLVKSVVLLSGAGLCALLATLTLLAGAVIKLGHHIGTAKAALLIGVLLLVAAGVLAAVGLKALKRGGLAPTQTLETLRDDAAWLKEQVKS